MIAMPMAFAKKENGMKTDVLAFVSPSIAIAISSGSGDAMMSAPIKGVTHLNSRDLKACRSLREVSVRSIALRSCPTLSRMNLKIK